MRFINAEYRPLHDLLSANFRSRKPDQKSTNCFLNRTQITFKTCYAVSENNFIYFVLSGTTPALQVSKLTTFNLLLRTAGLQTHSKAGAVQHMHYIAAQINMHCEIMTTLYGCCGIFKEKKNLLGS